MVFEFVQQGRHHDLLSDIHEACRHLKDALSALHPPAGKEAVLMSRSEAFRLHMQQDLKALAVCRQELARLQTRSASSWQAIRSLDLLDTAALQSILNREEASLAGVLSVYPLLANITPDTAQPCERSLMESTHARLEDAARVLSGMDSIVARLIALHEKRDFSGDGPPGQSPEPLARPPFPPSALLSAESPAQVEIPIGVSSYLEKQIRHGEVPKKDMSLAVKKIRHFVELNNIPSIPWHAEPHCYGGAPYHLNGVVVGKKERLIFFVEEDPIPVVKLCCWISSASHHDAFSHLRHQNIYRRILSKDPSSKITRKDFGGFVPIQHSAGSALIRGG